MDLLTITHRDFKLTVECSNFENIWSKAKKIVKEENLTTTYSWYGSDDNCETVLYIDGSPYNVRKNTKERAIFFDNTPYSIWVDFKTKPKNAWFSSDLQSESEKFRLRDRTLMGFLNYGNEIGRTELRINYEADGEKRNFTLSFEVLSSKLNYHQHWKKIVEDIENEYRLLALDYMKRTFHGFTPEEGGNTPDLIWFSIFRDEQRKFIEACRRIIERPRHKLMKNVSYERADKLRRINSNLEREIAEHRTEPAYLYRVEELFPSNDTQENRFLKYALNQIIQKFNGLKNRIETIKNVSKDLYDEMQDLSKTLNRLQKNSFFRTIGRFKGLNQESLVLQKASGYSQVYKTWSLLRRAYSLNDGIYKLQTKDIATLYEIWCFIEVSHIIRDQLKLEKDQVEQHNRTELNGLFTWELGKGEHSRILFKKDNIELAELIYNPRNLDKSNNGSGIDKDIYAPTAVQKPDIVLRLTKNDLDKAIKMTYLFDAKYRIDDRYNEMVDYPPEDAINQMHRYRDAIYYKEYPNAQNQEYLLKKEVIGGYILFPGDGLPVEVARSRFYKTINEVNIGAFPLRPCDERNRKFLEEFILSLIEKKAVKTLSEVIPQKGTSIEVSNRALIGIVKPSRRKDYKESFDEQRATLYYTGPKFPTTIALHNLRYFIPYIEGKGIRDLYEITRIRTITGGEAKQIEGDSDFVDDLRLAFELRFSRQLFDDYKMVHLNIDHAFIQTEFDELDKLVAPK